MPPKWDAGEIVFGIECDYGTLVYSYSGDPEDNNHQCAQLPACHNPVEDPDERHHCDRCGGDYCAVHAEPASHDCGNVIAPL